MDVVLAGLTVLALVLIYLGLGVWIFAGMLLVSLSSLLFLLGFPLDRIGIIAQSIFYRSATLWELSAIPLFIWMGEIVFRTDISDRLFRGLAPLTHKVPGRLLHTNIGGCTLFAAVSGSSAATTATVGKITTSALQDRRYDVDLSIGSLAGAGSLGLLIPPSIVMIVYGVLAEVSISKLFMAGFLPGVLIAGAYSAYIALRCLINPSLAPAAGDHYSIGEVIRGLMNIAPVGLLVVIVLGSIYTGIATPSEAATVGVVAALLLALATRQLTWSIFGQSLMGSVRLSCMIITLMVAASLLSTTMGYLHLPTELARAIVALDLSPFALIFVIGLFYLLLGCFLDGVSITVMTLPIVLPLVLQAGFDPIWFGVFLVIMVELGQITPPVGFNLFVLQGLTGYSIGRVARASIPFGILMCGCLIIVTVFPQIALWLPNQLLAP